MRKTLADRRARPLLAALAVVALVTAACGGDDDTTPSTAAPTGPNTEPTQQTDPPGATIPGTATPSTDEPASPDSGDYDLDATLVYAKHFVPTQFDPQTSANFRSDRSWQEIIYDSLLEAAETDNGIQVVGNLAESFEVSDDGLTMTLHLLEGVTFTDGTPFDSASVQANFERGQTLEASTVKTIFSKIASVDTPDASTVVLNLSEPDSALPYWLATVPGFQVSPAAFAGDVSTTPVGTSAYTMAQATEAGVTYERRTDGNIWNPQTGLVKTIRLVATIDDNARINGYLSGEYDVIEVRETTLELAKDVEADGEGTINYVIPQSPLVYYFNTSRPPFDDVRVRRALSLGIDRESLNEGLFNGTCTPTDQLFPVGIAGHLSDVTPAYDPEQAIALLAEAGVPDLSFEMVFAATPGVQRPAEAVQQMWADIGVNVTITPIDGGTVRAEFRGGRGDAAAILVPVDPPDPGNIMNQFVGVDNPGGQVDPELATLVETVNGLSVTDPARVDALQAVSEYLRENPLHVTACSPSTGNMFHHNVVRVLPSYDTNGVGGLAILKDG
ncbi:MAG TPA: ABC transporter substrate-binding protein [Ilumatobacter sp.]|nr:ABC transporter substrate-binding protein [Ilumatobacter sp.]